MQKGKWFSEEALQISEKRRKVKGKGEKEIYIYLNSEFQRIARKDKKAFISEQCQEIEENNRRVKSQLMKIKNESGKTGLKLNIQQTKIMASGPITSWQMEKQWKQ